MSKRFLSEGEKVVGIDSLDDYYDPLLKKARLDILKKFKGESFIFKKLSIEEKEISNKYF